MTMAEMQLPTAGSKEQIVTIWLNTAFQPRFRVIDGLTIRCAESKARGHTEALLLGPWPESLFAFEPIWGQLAEQARLVAIDLPGLGHSQRRDVPLSPGAMGDFVIAAADAFGLARPHVVGPGTGTAPALFAAARHRGRLASLVVGGGAAAVPVQLGGVVRDWVQTQSLAALRRADPQQLVTAALSGITRHVLPDAVRSDYISAYQGDRMAESIRYLRGCVADLPVLAGLLPQVDTPVQIIAGARDRVVPLANAEFLHHKLPHSKLDVLDAGHFTWEDAAPEYAALVTAWWRENGPACGPKE